MALRGKKQRLRYPRLRLWMTWTFVLRVWLRHINRLCSVFLGTYQGGNHQHPNHLFVIVRQQNLVSQCMCLSLIESQRFVKEYGDVLYGKSWSWYIDNLRRLLSHAQKDRVRHGYLWATWRWSSHRIVCWSLGGEGRFFLPHHRALAYRRRRFPADNRQCLQCALWLSVMPRTSVARLNVWIEALLWGWPHLCRLQSQEFAWCLLRAQNFPLLIIEDNVLRSEKFLQSPTTSKPHAWHDLFLHYIIVCWVRWREYLKERYNSTWSLIPLIHWIDSFAKLGAAFFVDATSIHPYKIIAIIYSVLAWLLNFRKAFRVGCHC